MIAVRWRTLNGHAPWLEGWVYLSNDHVHYLRTKRGLLFYADTVEWYIPGEQSPVLTFNG
jgi:hypothetical protein